MMDDYITSRGSTAGFSFDYLTTINSTSFQLYTIDNLSQYNSLAFYLKYPSNKIIVQTAIIPIDLFKTTTSSSWFQPTYYNGTFHTGQIYYNSENSFYAMMTSADSIFVYGLK